MDENSLDVIGNGDLTLQASSLQTFLFSFTLKSSLAAPVSPVLKSFSFTFFFSFQFTCLKILELLDAFNNQQRIDESEWAMQ